MQQGIITSLNLMFLICIHEDEVMGNVEDEMR